MKSLTTALLILLVPFVLTSCQNDMGEAAPASGAAEETAAAEDACDLVGSWEMVSMETTTPDSVVQYDESTRPTLKILNDTHWMFIRQSAATFIFAQGGRYTLDGDNYTEIVEYSADPNNIGNAYEFTCSVEGDSVWYHDGGLGNVKYDEVWRRVE